MIQNGKDLSLGQSAAGLPDVADAIIQVFQPVIIGIIAASQVNGRTQTIVKEYCNTKGVRIANNNKLAISKSGERIWFSDEIYFLRDIILKVDDVFLFNKFQFRVMALEEWTEYGYNKYSVLQDYTKIYQEKPVVI